MEELINKNTKWIWLADKRFQVNHWVEFRQTVELDNVERAQFIIAADTSYQLWINDQLVDDAYFSEFPEDKYYHAIDVSSYLRKGENCIAVLGYHQGVSTSRYVAGKPGILFQLQCGTKIVLQSDSTCKARTSSGYLSGNVSFVTVQLGLTLQYDASKDDNWKSVGYDDSFWVNAEELASANEFSEAGLKPYPIERFETCFKKAKLISNGTLEKVPQDGTFANLISGSILNKIDDKVGDGDVVLSASPEGNFVIFDLSREQCGYLQIDLEADEFTVIDIAHGEHLVDGHVRAKIADRNFADRYITRKGPQKWSMPVRKLGGRYLELHVRNKTGQVRVNSVGINAVEYPTRINDEFECSDKLLEAIMDVSQRTAKLCMLENYVDTPWREQSLYSLDAANQALGGYYLFGEYDYAEKCLSLLGKGRFCSKYLSMCAPSDLEITIPIFTMVWVAAVRDFTLFSGRTTLAEEYFDYISGFIYSLIDELEEGVLKVDRSEKYWNFYEWSQGLDGNGPYAEDTKDYHSGKTLFLLEAIEAYNDICGYLEKDSVVQQEVISQIVKGLGERYSTDNGLYANEYPVDSKSIFSELTQSLACRFMNLDCSQTQGIKKHMGGNSNLVPATLSMKKYVFSALDGVFDDDSQSSLDMIRRDWGYMLSKGAATFWETIKGDADFDGAGSLCHAWSSIPAFYIYAEIIGVKPVEPGFKKFEFSPKFADIDFIKGSIPTPYGDIRVQWRRKENVIELEVEYPIQIEMVNKINDKYGIILKTKSYGKIENERSFGSA